MTLGYSPFGLKQKGYNYTISGGNDLAQQWKFAGKELSEDLGLDSYDFGARNYDASLGRWFGVDNLAEVYHTFSPYHYSANNPILFVDLDGNGFADAHRFISGGSNGVSQTKDPVDAEKKEEEKEKEKEKEENSETEINSSSNSNALTSPIYDSDGNYLGFDSEGFSGAVIIMNKDVFNALGGNGIDHDIALRNGTTLDIANLSLKAQLRIFNDIISYSNGMKTDFGIPFDINSIREGSITQSDRSTNWAYRSNKDGSFSLLRGINKLPYEMTVENVILSVIIHEWFSHGIMGTADTTSNHYEAYLSVMSHPMFSKATNVYKGFNAYNMKAYYQRQVGSFSLVPKGSLLRTFYNKNKNYIREYKLFSGH